MTDSPNVEPKPELLAVTQEDREAAEAYLQTPVEMSGEHPLAAAFARHRLNTRPSPTRPQRR